MSSAALPSTATPTSSPRIPFDGRRAGVVARRVIRQVLRDRRSLAMLVAVPVLVILLLGSIMRSSYGAVTLAVSIRAPATERLPRLADLPLPAGLRVAPAGDEAAGDLRDGRIDGLLTLKDGAPAALTVRGDNPTAVKLLQAAAAQIIEAARRPVDAPPPGGGAASTSGAPVAVPTSYLQGGPEFDALDYEAPALIGFFAFFFVFLLASVSFLRERTTGTLERLLISPLRRLELVAGYMIGFGLFALVQGFLVVLVSVAVLRVHYQGSLVIALLVVALLAILSVNLGIFCSTFARTELQAVQFIPIVLVPQTLLSGLLFAVDSLPRALQIIAHLLPLTYASDALRGVMIGGAGLRDGAIQRDLLLLFLFAAGFLAAGAHTLKQQIA